MVHSMMKFRIMRLHLGLHRLPFYPFGGVNGLKMVKAGFCANVISIIISFGGQFTFLSYKHNTLVLFKVNIWQLHIRRAPNKGVDAFSNICISFCNVLIVYIKRAPNKGVDAFLKYLYITLQCINFCIKRAPNKGVDTFLKHLYINLQCINCIYQTGALQRRRRFFQTVVYQFVYIKRAPNKGEDTFFKYLYIIFKFINKEIDQPQQCIVE